MLRLDLLYPTMQKGRLFKDTPWTISIKLNKIALLPKEDEIREEALRVFPLFFART